MILKQKGDERIRSCGSRRLGPSFEKFFLCGYFTRIVYLLCLWYPFGLVFFLKLTSTFLISIGQSLFQSHSATENYKRNEKLFNPSFLFLSPKHFSLGLVNMLSTIRLVFFLNFKFLS